MLVPRVTTPVWALIESPPGAAVKVPVPPELTTVGVAVPAEEQYGVLA